MLYVNRFSLEAHVLAVSCLLYLMPWSVGWIDDSILARFGLPLAFLAYFLSFVRSLGGLIFLVPAFLLFWSFYITVRTDLIFRVLSEGAFSSLFVLSFALIIPLLLSIGTIVFLRSQESDT